MNKMAQLNITLDTELLHGLFTKETKDEAFSKLLEEIFNQVLIAQSTEQLYAVAYTIKMSKMGDHRMVEYFDFVVPPLEGFWWQEGINGVDYSRKDKFNFISVIRLPDFVTESEFEWAVKEAESKKKIDLSNVEFFTYDEGLCVQCMHIGPFEDEPATVSLMHESLSILCALCSPS